ncbi:transporter [Candidatus Latescibacterota bacterium]
MKKVTVLALFVIGVCFLSSSVLAYDDLIYLDRGSKIGDSGTLWGKAGLRYSTAGDMLDKDGEKQSLADDATGINVPLWAHYTIMENLQAFAILPIVSNDNGVDSESGVGDIWLGAKYAVLQEGLLSIRGALDIPTGDDEKGLGNAGGFGIDIAAQAERQCMLNENINFFGQLGIRYNGEDSDTKWNPGLGFYLNGRATYAVTEKIPAWIALTYFNRGDGEADGTEITDSKVSWLELSVGGAYRFTEDMWIAVPVGYSLTGANTLAELSIGVYVGYQFMK